MPDIINKRSSPRARSTPLDWLPNVRPGGTSANIKVIRKGKVQERKDSDWFLALGAAMEQRDAVQSRLFTKFYFFLGDFIPQGLSDDKFGHIGGNDVMDQLLSHPNESTALRHKLTKYAKRCLSGPLELDGELCQLEAGRQEGQIRRRSRQDQGKQEESASLEGTGPTHARRFVE